LVDTKDLHSWDGAVKSSCTLSRTDNSQMMTNQKKVLTKLHKTLK